MSYELLNAEAISAVAQLDVVEREMLRCFTSGMSLRKTAETISLSLEDAREMKLALMRKFRAPATADLVRIGLYAGLGQIEDR